MERHEKWTRVEAGTIIPAGQPYRVEHPPDVRAAASLDRQAVAAEYPGRREAFEVTDQSSEACPRDYFVDSSWRPPLVLPTEPTWGIAVYDAAGGVSMSIPRQFVVDGDVLEGRKLGSSFPKVIAVKDVLDFIPLTEEQVQRIEAAR